MKTAWKVIVTGNAIIMVSWNFVLIIFDRQIILLHLYVNINSISNMLLPPANEVAGR